MVYWPLVADTGLLFLAVSRYSAVSIVLSLVIISIVPLSLPLVDRL